MPPAYPILLRIVLLQYSIKPYIYCVQLVYDRSLTPALY
ncbi:putative chemotaxisprotein [Spirochaeta thermophila DSM 6192]|uniref:Putative chemotaxisprotein n=1 Tax=Winmispira thermophila (strain ATCC 49972 / DSM 6192 / RI 19.B1) TaxID=665571 RepID=E0RNU7_WINT6|nr:putative chemotaxisprotein [Spirochaeta thermophila DSM 6192]